MNSSLRTKTVMTWLAQMKRSQIRRYVYYLKKLKYDTNTVKENLYYHAKSLKDGSIEDALKTFEKVTYFDDVDSTEWKFRSYKQQLKIYYKQKEYDRALENLGRLVSISPKLNGNYAEESISKLISRYSMSSNQTFVLEMYDVIISHLQDFMVSGASGKRLWLRININRLNNLLTIGDIDTCKKLTREINETLDSVSELIRNSYALDVIAAEITCVMRSGGSLAELSQLHRRSLKLAPAIIHPRVMGVIRECGATVQFFRKNYDRSRVEFFECFKNYDEAGSLSKNKVLKYLALCSLLIESEVNPFESQETQSYSQLAEFQNLIQLISAYENQDLKYFLEMIILMRETNDPLSNDAVFLQAQEQILHNLKVRVLLTLVRAYKTVGFDYLIERLYLKNDGELEKLLIIMVNNGSGPNIKTNFSERYIECGDDKSFFPVALDSQMVTSSLKTLFRLDYKGPWKSATVDQALPADEPAPLHIYDSPKEIMDAKKKAASNIYEMLFCNSIHVPLARVDEQEWYKYMISLLPHKTAILLSQKEKVISEHIQEEKLGAQVNQEDEEASKNTTQGLLGSSLQYEALRPPENNTTASSIGKIDVLQKWTHELSKSFKY